MDWSERFMLTITVELGNGDNSEGTLQEKHLYPTDGKLMHSQFGRWNVMGIFLWNQWDAAGNPHRQGANRQTGRLRCTRMMPEAGLPESRTETRIRQAIIWTPGDGYIRLRRQREGKGELYL